MFVLPTVTGREWSDWSSELRIPGDELKWKFISDGSVNGWGWRFTVYPIMPAAGKVLYKTFTEGRESSFICLFFLQLYLLHDIYMPKFNSSFTFILKKHFHS